MEFSYTFKSLIIDQFEPYNLGQAVVRTDWSQKYLGTKSCHYLCTYLLQNNETKVTLNLSVEGLQLTVAIS